MYSPRRIFGRSTSKSSAVDRVHSVWPGLSTTWLYDRMEEVARAGVPRWIQNEFWIAEVDPILRVGHSKGTSLPVRCGRCGFKGAPGTARWRRLGATERSPESAKLRYRHIIGVDAGRIVQR